MDEGTRPANPGVRFPPPLLFAIGVLLGWIIDRRMQRWALLPESVAGAAEIAGVLLAAAGLALIAWGMLTFSRARTGIIPNQPATQLVYAGPYRFTRNSMYTGMATAYLGLTLLANSVWPLLFLPFVIALLHRFVIRCEEHYLEATFGAEYHTYRSRVRRWL